MHLELLVVDVIHGVRLFVDWDWVRLMGGVVFLGSLNGWVGVSFWFDGLGSEIGSCGLLLLLLPLLDECWS